jgi:hypothetical protein
VVITESTSCFINFVHRLVFDVEHLGLSPAQQAKEVFNKSIKS